MQLILGESIMWNNKPGIIGAGERQMKEDADAEKTKERIRWRKEMDPAETKEFE